MSTPYNDHVLLASAMLRGHLWVNPPPAEHVTINGLSYILHPPLSALICLPFVAAGYTDQQKISWLLGAMSILLMWRYTRSMWLTLFFTFGTTFLWESYLGASWNFALVASVPFTLLALQTEGWISSLCAGLAALARYDLVLAFPVYACRWYEQINKQAPEHIKRTKGQLFKAALPFIIGPLVWAAVSIWYNEERFGTLFDVSIPLWYRVDRYQPGFGPFSIHYLPKNLYTLLFMAPAFQPTFPWFRPTSMGQSLLTLSPAFLLAFGDSPWLLAAMLASIPSLTVYASGFMQLGCRYYVQVFPFLIAAMMQNMQGKQESANSKILIMLSIILSTYFMLVCFEYGW